MPRHSEDQRKLRRITRLRHILTRRPSTTVHWTRCSSRHMRRILQLMLHDLASAVAAHA
jgi:hypothetical protein